MIKIITHRDLDGACSEILLRSLYPSQTVYSSACGYSQIDGAIRQFFRSRGMDRFDHLIISDIEMGQHRCLSLVENQIQRFPERIFVYDHHARSRDLYRRHPENTIVDTEHCTASLIYETLDVDSSYRKLAYLAKDHDLWERKHKASQYLSYLYYFYWHHEFVSRFVNGYVSFSENERKFIKKHHRKLQKARRKNIPEDFFESRVFVTRAKPNYKNWIMSDILDQNENSIVINIEPSAHGLAMRTKREDFDVGKFLEGHGGGGHPKAGGCEYDGEVFEEIMDDLSQFVL